MPPGQPVHRCFGCDLLRPCKRFEGDLLCVECAPSAREPDEPDARPLATDGGEHVEAAPIERRRSATVDGTTVRLTATVEPDGTLDEDSRTNLAEAVLDDGLGNDGIRWDGDGPEEGDR